MNRKKHFGPGTLTLLVIASMIGAGVFTTSGFTLQELGSAHRVIVAWVIGGLVALAGAVSYGRLIQVMPESGGEYLFLTRAAHPLVGFLAGWVSLIAGFTGAIALAAVALENYLLPAGLRPTWLPANSVAVGVVVIAGVSHGLRPRGGAMLQNGAVLLKLGLLAVFLGFAAIQVPDHPWHTERLAGISNNTWTLVGAMASSLVWISLSYSGFNAAVYVADEVEQAKLVIPKALMRGTLIVMLLYLLLNAVFVYAQPPQDIAGKADIAAVAAGALGGKPWSTLIRATISIALFTSVLSMIMAAPRVYAKMAEDGLLPVFFQFQGNAPRLAVVAQVVLAVVLILFSSLRGLLTYLGLTLSLSAACSVGCLFLPRIRSRPWLHRSHIAPAIFILCTFAIATLATIANPWQIVGTASTVLVGLPAYALASISHHKGHKAHEEKGKRFECPDE